LDETHFYKKIVVEDEALEIPFRIYRAGSQVFANRDFTEMFAYQNMQIQEVFGDR
jgi:hypothetical protein